MKTLRIIFRKCWSGEDGILENFFSGVEKRWDGKDLTSDLRRSWLPCPWESRKNTRSMCDSGISHLGDLSGKPSHLFISLCIYPWLPQGWASWVGLQSPPMGRWQKWITFGAHGLSSWEAPISGNSPPLCVCAVLFAHDPLLSGTSWSDVTLVHFPMGAEQVTLLLQPLSIFLNELLLVYLISSKQNVITFPWGPVLEAWLYGIT